MNRLDFPERKIKICKLKTTDPVKWTFSWDSFDTIGQNSQLRNMEQGHCGCGSYKEIHK